MKVRVYRDTCVMAYGSVLNAFYRGAHRVCTSIHDSVKFVTGHQYIPSDVAVIMWSPKITEGKEFTVFRKYVFDEQQKRGLKTIIIETAIIRGNKKHAYFRVGLDDVSNLGEFANHNSPSQRWKAMRYSLNVNLHQWRQPGEKILIVGQHPEDFSLGGLDFNSWVEQTIQEVKQQSNRPIVYKPHPVALTLQQPNIDIPIITDEEFNWNDYYTSISYCSGMAVDSVMQGVPAITLSNRSFAWDVSTHDLKKIEKVIRPNREQWIYNLAYTQWTKRELRVGTPFLRLKPILKGNKT